MRTGPEPEKVHALYRRMVAVDLFAEYLETFNQEMP